MKRRLGRFVLIVLWAIALVLSDHARAEEKGAALECPGLPAEACAMRESNTAVAIMGDLRTPLDAAQLALGAAAIARAQAIGGKTERECELIDAVAQFYHRHDERTHDMRLVHYERALSRARRLLPDDSVIAMLHAQVSKVALARARVRAEAAYARRGAPELPSTAPFLEGTAK
jgi:hypothetical protein